MNALQINRNSWHIACPLTYPYIGSLEKRSSKIRPTDGNNEWVIDLYAVEDIDSAGLAWLLENIRHAAYYHIALKIKGFHCDKAQALAEVQGIEEILQQYLI